MQRQTQGDTGPEFPFVSTGHLPTSELVAALVAEAHASSNTEGENSQLTRPAPECLAICSASQPSAKLSFCLAPGQDPGASFEAFQRLAGRCGS
jgi:hypothetical protein